jgi:PAS domain S-box-containing protein
LENIHTLTALCGELVRADCALYNRLVDGQLVAWGQWQTPTDFLAVDTPEGHICTDVIRQHCDDVVLIRNLPHTSYADSDPYVARYQLQTYMGHPVSLGDLPVGSLCAVYARDFVPTESERMLFSIIATAIGIEESRKHANDLLVIQRDLEQQLAGEHDLQAALHRCLATAIRVSGMDSGGIYLVNSASSTLELVASQGLSERFLRAVHTYPLDSDRGRLLNAGQAIYTAYDDLSIDTSPVTLDEGLRSIGIIPVQIEDVLLGSINVASHSAAEMHANARVSIEAIAGQIGSVVLRLRTTAMLQQREVEFASFFHAITDFLFILDDTGNIRRVNTAVIQRLGYTEDELIGQSVLLVHPPDRREEAQRIVLAMLAGERVFCLVPLQAKDGTLIPVETRATPGNVGDQQILVGISRDITERQQAEEALRNSETRLRIVLDTLPDLVWLKNPQGVYLACNPRFEQFFGASEAEIVGKTDYDFVAPALADFFREKDRATMKAGQPCVNEEDVTFASDGHQEHLETIKTPLYDAEGHLLGTLGIARDITHRKQAEVALRESEARFRLLAEQAPFGVGMNDAQGRIIYVNPLFTEICGYTRDEVPTIAAWAARAYPDEDYRQHVFAQWDADIAQVRAGALAYSPAREYRVVCADGTVRDLIITFALSDELLFAFFNDITARKQTELALQHSEARYRLLTENAGEIIWTTDLSGRLTYISAAVERLRGFHPDELVRRPFSELLAPASATRLADVLREELLCERDGADLGRTRVVEAEVTHRDGARHWIEMTMTFQRDAAGIPVGVLGVSRDITERKRMLETLRGNEELLQAMASCSPLAFYVVDNRTDAILYANHQFCVLWGLTEIEDAVRNGEMTNNATIPYCIPRLADVEGFAASCKPLQSEANRAVVEDEIPLRDGRVIRRYSTQIRDASDRYFGRFYLFEDITARKHIEAALTYRLAFEDLIATLSTQFINCPLTQIAPEITRALGAIGTFMHADRAYVFTFSADQQLMNNTHEWCGAGITPEIDNLQQLPIDIFPWWMARLRAHETIHVPRVADLPPEADAEREILLAQDIQSVVVIPLEAEGQVIGFLGFDAVREERAWTEDAVRLLTMVGDLVVNALARKHTGEQVQGLQADLEHHLLELNVANQELEAFTYSVSHDLRAPLWNIASFAEALEHGADLAASEATRDLVIRIRQGSERMTEMIDALLMLSRLSRESITFVPFSLSAMAHEICERLQQASPARYATITIGPDIEVTADPRLLRIALENLLGNAWKYTSKRDHASITLGVLAQGGETVYYLQDNGAGFDMAHRERLFTPFQRLHRERDFPGTGIGLATVQRIIHRHGGRIWADGQVGYGATFYFTLGSAGGAALSMELETPA